MEKLKNSPLSIKSKAFAFRIINLHKYLREEKNEYVMSKQVLRCGTSIGANVAESLYAQSELDLISKLSISRKECSETLYWFELLLMGEYLDEKQYNSLQEDAIEIMKILTSSIKTLKDKIK